MAYKVGNIVLIHSVEDFERRNNHLLNIYYDSVTMLSTWIYEMCLQFIDKEAEAQMP